MINGILLNIDAEPFSDEGACRAYMNRMEMALSSVYPGTKVSVGQGAGRKISLDAGENLDDHTATMEDIEGVVIELDHEISSEMGLL